MTFVGARRDASFGPVVLVGAGGIHAEALDDTSRHRVPSCPPRQPAVQILDPGHRRLIGTEHEELGAAPQEIDDLRRELRPQRIAVQLQLLLAAQMQRRETGALGVVFLRQGGAEQRHDPVAHDLVHGALVAVDRLHHELQHRIEDAASLLRIAIEVALGLERPVDEPHATVLTDFASRPRRGFKAAAAAAGKEATEVLSVVAAVL